MIRKLILDLREDSLKKAGITMHTITTFKDKLGENLLKEWHKDTINNYRQDEICILSKDGLETPVKTVKFNEKLHQREFHLDPLILFDNLTQDNCVRIEKVLANINWSASD